MIFAKTPFEERRDGPQMVRPPSNRLAMTMAFHTNVRNLSNSPVTRNSRVTTVT